MMPRTANIPFSIDVNQYMRLPRDIRIRFDGWLTAETLIDKHVIELTLGEGEVVVERYVTADNGRFLRDPDNPDEALRELARYPVGSLPPREVFEALIEGTEA